MFAYSSSAGLYQPQLNTPSEEQSATATVIEASLLLSHRLNFKKRKLRKCI